MQKPTYAVEDVLTPALSPNRSNELEVERKVNTFPLVVQSKLKYPVTVLYEATIPQFCPASAVANLALSAVANTVPFNDVPASNVIVNMFPLGA